MGVIKKSLGWDATHVEARTSQGIILFYTCGLGKTEKKRKLINSFVHYNFFGNSLIQFNVSDHKQTNILNKYNKSKCGSYILGKDSLYSK